LKASKETTATFEKDANKLLENDIEESNLEEIKELYAK